MMESFRFYMNETDGRVVERALDGQILDDEEEDDLQELLARVDCHSIPKGDALAQMVLKVAHKVLIQQPKYALDEMGKAARGRLSMVLPDINDIKCMYTSKKPSCRKVLRLLQSNPMNAEQDAVFSYLKEFIKGLKEPVLKKFLRFVTGAEIICIDHIDVSFNKNRGMKRIPIARTCGPVLELSSTYTSYREMRQELLSVLESNFLKMDIA